LPACELGADMAERSAARFREARVHRERRDQVLGRLAPIRFLYLHPHQSFGETERIVWKIVALGIERCDRVEPVRAEPFTVIFRAPLPSFRDRNVQPLRSVSAIWSAGGAELIATNRRRARIRGSTARVVVTRAGPSSRPALVSSIKTGGVGSQHAAGEAAELGSDH